MNHQKSMTEEEFLAGYEAYSDGIFRFCFYKTSDREHALELTQEVFFRAWNDISKGTEIRLFKTYLYTIARRMIIDYYRKQKTLSLESLQETGFDVAGEPTPSTTFDAEQLRTLINTFDEKYRDVLLLRYSGDLSVKEIAQTLNLSENVVSVRLHRGIQQLKKHYEGLT